MKVFPKKKSGGYFARMIKAKLTFLIFLSAVSPLYSQTQNVDFAYWEALISRQINYPIEAIRARKEGIVAIGLSIDSNANLIEIKLVKKASPYFDDQVLKAVEAARDFWKPEMLADRKPGESYLLVFNFVMIQEGNSKENRIKSAVNYIQKGKPEQALKIADRLVKENPYDAQSLELRSQIHRQLGNEEEATTDLMAFQKIQNQILAQIDVKVMQQVNTRTVSGSLPNR